MARDCYDQKCETLVNIGRPSKDGNVRFFPSLNAIAFSHDDLPKTVHAYYYDPDMDVETDTSELDRQVIDAKIPNQIATLTFTTVSNEAGTCNAPSAENRHLFQPPCIHWGATKEGKSAIKMEWVWDNATYGKRFGIGFSKGRLYERNCESPGANDYVVFETNSTYWSRLRAPTDAGGETTEQRTGDYTMKTENCGLIEVWRVHFYDTNIGIDRAGMTSSFFDMKVGLDGCCGETEIEPVENKSLSEN